LVGGLIRKINAPREWAWSAIKTEITGKGKHRWGRKTRIVRHWPGKGTEKRDNTRSLIERTADERGVVVANAYQKSWGAKRRIYFMRAAREVVKKASRLAAGGKDDSRPLWKATRKPELYKGNAELGKRDWAQRWFPTDGET